MKLHVNRTCFHAGLKSQTGVSSFRLSCERTLNTFHHNTYVIIHINSLLLLLAATRGCLQFQRNQKCLCGAIWNHVIGYVSRYDV